MAAPVGYKLRGTFTKNQKGLLKADQDLVRYAGFKTRTVHEGGVTKLYIKKRG